ncbi:hypothetical protein LINGRAHAP2_LOCUS31378 [Linum grandiflorum]
MCRRSSSRSHLDDSDGEPNPSNPKDQHRCSPRKIHNLWKSTTVKRRTFVAEEGLVLLSICGRLALTDDIQFFIKKYNTADHELKVAEGKVVRFMEEDVERVYELYREIFDEAQIGKKGYTEADVNLMLILMLDRLGVEPGDRVLVLRPTVRYWTSTVMKNRLQ